ncbi:MAG: M16 family metallopeptidase [Chlorobiota bacterium]
MIRNIILLALGLFAMSSAVLVSQDNENVFPYDYEVNTLENGLKIITIPMPSNGIVSYYTLVRTGARDEYEQGKTGFAHFFEHMMFRGTKKYPGSVYDSLIISIGADGNAYTTDDYTAYHLSLSKEDLDLVMELESDRFQNLSYPEADFKTEAGAVYGEYRKNITNPISVLWEKLKYTAYDKHTYKHSTIGFVEDIKAMPTLYEYSMEFYSNYYRPENSILMVAGDISTDEILEKAKKYYGSWEKGYTAPKVEQEPEQTAPRSAEVKYDGKTNPIVGIGYKAEAFDATDKSVIARELIGDLAFGSNSDLYKKLYLKEQKVQYISPYFPQNRDPFMSIIYTMVNDPSDIDYVKEEVQKSVEWYQNNLVDKKKLEDLKKRQKYAFLMSLDTPANVTGNLARIVAITGGMDAVEQYFQTLASITPEDIQEEAKTMTEDKRTIIELQGAK